MARIIPFKAGYCTHRECIAVQGTGLKTCQFPAQTFLLEANGHYWLWDTGYSHHFTDATRHGIFKLYATATPVYFESHEAIYQQLKAYGLNTRDLEALIISHFHGDHIAGLKDFPETNFIASHHGWHAMKSLRNFSALRQGFIPSLIPSTFESCLTFIETFKTQTLPTILQPFHQGYALPKSQGEIIIVPLPGHAHGHIGAFILTDTGWQLLASDAAWAQANYRGQPPSPLSHLIMADSRQFRQTLGALSQLDQKNIPIILSHEERQ